MYDAPIPAAVRSSIRLRTPRSIDQSPKRVSFDIEIADESGNVLVEVSRFEMQRVDTKQFGSSTATAARKPVAEKTLTTAEKLFADTYELGIEPDEGEFAFKFAIEHQATGIVYVSPIDLPDLRSRFVALHDRQPNKGIQFSRPTSSAAIKTPSNRTEKWLADLWQDLLGIEQVGIADNFFDLGGHSLLAVRLFGKLRQQRGIDLPLSTLLEAPTIEQIAKLIDQSTEQTSSDAESAATRPIASANRFLVPLHIPKSTEKPPRFMVSGMFGNVLNLRYLATRLGVDQPVYGIQAKGLIGDETPHRTFAEMASDYLVEIRRLQPTGPYFIGGFSGGGISAYEMAQQLSDAGDQVGILIMLDTRAILHQQLRLIDKAKIQLDRIQKQGFKYFKTRRMDRASWAETTQRAKDAASREGGAEFRSSLIRDAFMDAHANYHTQPYVGDVHLFRPPLDVAHHLPGGRRINKDRQFMDDLNGWRPFVEGQIKRFEVAGDHDSMVLEPHVRTMASQLKRCLEESYQRMLLQDASASIRADVKSTFEHQLV